MIKLLLVCSSALILVMLSEKRSTWTIDRNGVKKYIRKEHFLFFVSCLILAVFVGLRIRGNDTFSYRHYYGLTPNNISAFDIDWMNIAGAPGLQFVMACLRNLGASSQDYLMVMALFTVMIYMWFIHKYSNDLVVSVYLFITMGVYLFTGAAIKQTAAMAILTIATDRALQNKKVAFLFWIIMAELFHPYSFIYLIIPFLQFPPWTNKTGFLLLGSAIVAFGLSFFMRGMVELTELLGYETYSISELSGSGVNIMRVLVVWVPAVLALVSKDQLKENNEKIPNTLINASMICSMIMFIGLFGTANYFARLANYFLIFQTLSLPYLIRLLGRSTRRTITYVMVVLFFAYFYYENNILRGGFRAENYMSIMDFLRQL